MLFVFDSKQTKLFFLFAMQIYLDFMFVVSLCNLSV